MDQAGYTFLMLERIQDEEQAPYYKTGIATAADQLSVGPGKE